nr:MAG TPA: hypothetical protein [Caudoviricetes sp.]
MRGAFFFYLNIGGNMHLQNRRHREVERCGINF